MSFHLLFGPGPHLLPPPVILLLGAAVLLFSKELPLFFFAVFVAKEARAMKISKIEAFQIRWSPDDKLAQGSAFVRVYCEGGISGIGEASPMQGGIASLGIVARDIAPALIGKDSLDHAVLLDTALHRLVKLGPEGALTGALAALDIALWDIKGKLFGQPIYKLLGGAWRMALPFYASIGGNGERTVDEVLRVVEARMKKSAVRRQNPLRCGPHQSRCRYSWRYRQGEGGAQAGRRCVPFGVRCQ
jgi:hypothetical protein